MNLLILTFFAIWIGRHLSIPSGPGSFPFTTSSLNVFLSHIISSKKKPGSIFQTWLKNIVCPSSFSTSSAFHTTEGHNSAKFSARRMIRILFLQIPVMSFSLYPEILPAASLTSIFLLSFPFHQPLPTSWFQFHSHILRISCGGIPLSCARICIHLLLLPNKLPSIPLLLEGSFGSLSSVQFSSVAQSCPTLCDPMNRSTPGLHVHHQLPEFTQTHVHRVSDAIQPSHPLSFPSPPALNPSQHQNLIKITSLSQNRLISKLDYICQIVFPI